MAAGKKTRIPWAGLILLGLTSLFLFGVLELGFRIVERMQEATETSGESWAVYDEDLAYQNKPHFGDHNAEGHRDHALDDPKRRLRLLVLGDSVPYYGDDLDDTWPGQLENLLAARETEPVEVVNAGTRGYTVFQERIYLEKYGADLEPDVVGLCFVLNDVHTILHRFKVVDGEIVGQEYSFEDDAVEGVESPLYQLARRSHLLVWLRGQLGVFDDLIALYTRDGFAFDYRPDFNTAWKEDRWDLVEKQVSAMVELGKERGFRFFVVVVPFADQLDPDVISKDPDYVGLPQRKMAELGAKLGFPVLDLRPALQPEDMDDDRVHFSPSGRRVAAEQVADFLLREGLVPRSPETPSG
jgi:lysophospholipase L1-like esterase